MNSIQLRSFYSIPLHCHSLPSHLTTQVYTVDFFPWSFCTRLFVVCKPSCSFTSRFTVWVHCTGSQPHRYIWMSKGVRQSRVRPQGNQATQIECDASKEREASALKWWVWGSGGCGFGSCRPAWWSIGSAEGVQLLRLSYSWDGRQLQAFPGSSLIASVCHLDRESHQIFSDSKDQLQGNYHSRASNPLW